MGASLKTTNVARRLGTFAGAAALVVSLDQLVKAWARAALAVGEPETLIPHVMDLSLVYNTGAAFSMGEGKGLLFVAIAAVITVGCAVLCWREETIPVPLAVSLGCVAGGGIGNAIDRIVAGKVTDFFATTFMDFAVFNVADIFITCGVAVAFILWTRWDRAREAADAAEA
ncbi:signal peptidase II [Paratractidigestivibacter sp.]|uniref:signal peptidase II n=1 Tax=Paratractidigestivibacter sp. TaxID=2847316 RepID=UPI002ABE59F5|nr:signal peptidase II [Paratractidigestivibacter sp.]